MEQFQPIDFNLIPLSGSRFTPLIKDLPLILQTHSQSLPVTKKPLSNRAAPILLQLHEIPASIFLPGFSQCH